MRGEDVGGNRKDALIRHACGVTPSPRGGVGKASAGCFGWGVPVSS